MPDYAQEMIASMNSHNGVINALARKEGIASARPGRFSNIRQAAENLSRRNVDLCITELLNEALARLTVLCYERGDDGQLCNVDPATGRLLIPLPWGKAGHAKWGISESEADTMRAIMFRRQRVGLPLFHFDRSRRAWYLNLAEYPDGAGVLAQLAEWEVTVAEYREARTNGK